MSRAEKNAIIIPDGVKVAVTDGVKVKVDGKLGTLEKTFPMNISVAIEGSQIWVKRVEQTRQAMAMTGTAHSLIRAMIGGVIHGYSKDLEISGVGFKANLKGKALDLSLGTSHPIVYSLPDGVQVTVQDGVKLHVQGIDKQLVGQVAADIKSFYPMEPYKGKGVRIVGEFVRRKEGKKTA